MIDLKASKIMYRPPLEEVVAHIVVETLNKVVAIEVDLAKPYNLKWTILII